jgi:hypothetical protein
MRRKAKAGRIITCSQNRHRILLMNYRKREHLSEM